MVVYFDDFLIILLTGTWIFCKIDIFSETISPGGTYLANWAIKHHLILLVESIQDHG